MSHPITSHDPHNERAEDSKFAPKKSMVLRSMSHAAHTFPEFKSIRKQFEGINSTKKNSTDKSIRRHTAKTKALMGKSA